MKKVFALLLTFSMMMSLSVTAFASENPTEIDVYAKVVRNVEGEFDAPIQNGTADVTLDDNTSVSVTNVPSGAIALMVVPIPKTEKEAWDWITDCVKSIATPIHTFDIYFVNSAGDRLDANGAVVIINCPHCTGTLIVCSLDTDGTVHVLNTASRTRAVGVTFTTNGSPYYVMAEKTSAPEYDDDHDVDIEKPVGGDVEVSDKTPETGDTVTITPKPDNGKEVDKVIVKDEDGNSIPVTDNGDGTYSYEQPDGDVTIEVIFEDKDTSSDDDNDGGEPEHDVTIETPTGGDVGVSDKTPETGDTVTITPKPDSGKEVDKVIVKDEDGNVIPVTDNGDGTYSYKQPDGDITVEVIFKDKPISDTDPVKPNVPATGDNSHVGLWFSILIVSALGLILLLFTRRKKEEKQ